MTESTTGRVEHVHVAPESGAPMEPREAVEAVAGRGLRGDRYFDDEGTWSGDPDARDVRRDATLFEAEVLDVVERDHDIRLEPAEHRRNVTTRGVAVSHLLDERFRIGDAVLEGVAICEPCSYLESITEEGVLEALVHRGGLNAAVVESGTFGVGDRVEVVP